MMTLKQSIRIGAAATGILLKPVWGDVEDATPFYYMEEQTVTASHFESNTLDVPADITHISQEQIEQSAATGVPEILEAAANLHVRSFNGKSNEGELAMRGFGENSHLRVLVLVDGIKVNRPDMGNIEWQLLSLQDIESIEVIRGGQTVLYGNHALAGVVKIKTRQGGPTRFNFSNLTGSHDFSQSHGSAQGQSGDFDYRLSANYLHDKGFRKNSLSWSRGAEASIGYHLKETDEIRLKLAYSEGYLQYPGPLTYAQFMEAPESSANNGAQDSDSRNQHHSITWQGECTWGEYTVMAGYTSRDLEWNLDGIYAQNNQAGYSVSPKIKWGDSDRFIQIGSDHIYDTLHFDDFLDEAHTITRAQADLSRLTSAIYTYGQINLTDSINLNTGLRYELSTTDYAYEKYDPNQINPYAPVIWNPYQPNPNFTTNPDIIESYDDTLHKHGWAGELSINYRPTAHWSLWAGYDRVYRYPSLDEVAAYQGYPLAEPLNTELEPEIGHNFELGLKYIQGNWRLSASAYFLKLENEIAFDDVQNLNINFGSTQRHGSDLSLEYTTTHYGASTKWSYVEARLDGGPNDGRYVPLVPKVHGITQIWCKPLSTLRLSLSVSTVADRFQGGDLQNANTPLDSYNRMDAQATWTPLDSMTFFLKANNLSNRNYASSAYNGGYYPNAGRGFIFGTQIRF